MLRFLPILFFCLLYAPAIPAQFLRPHEPFDSSKAQSLPLEEALIVTDDEEYQFQLEYADTDIARSIGLMHRAEIQARSGMLFDFKRDRMVGMWMRNTFIPLDMLFLSKAGAIVTIVENTIPHNERVVSSQQRVRAVLELKAGTVKRLRIKAGDQVRHAMFEE